MRSDGRTELIDRLCASIVDYLRDESPPVGSRLSERGLAERLGVSRTPVRGALARLEREGVLDRSESGRYAVARTGPAVQPARAADDADYLRVAEDVLAGALPERVTRNELQRRYDLPRARVDALLTRMANEGWVAPLPGYGWAFLPVLTSLQSYRDSYRFRLLVEPAGILEPSFELDADAVRRRRAEQQRLVDTGLAGVSAAGLFDLNTRFHETIAACTRNQFFTDGLVRLNRLRRLVEYRQALVPERAVVRCREHVALADLLLAGERERASAFLREHLDTVGTEKSGGTP
jgi:DNA-binding GntR family transcriptional regulator